MTDGKEQLTFPGPGGYKIEWAPGAVHVPLRAAPSGHLVFVVDSYGKIRARSGGVPDKSFTLHTNVHGMTELSMYPRSSPTPSSSSSSSPPPPAADQTPA